MRPRVTGRVAAVGQAVTRAVFQLNLVVIVVHPHDPKVSVAAVTHDIADLGVPSAGRHHAELLRLAHGSTVALD